jgi:hypothetical protein
MVTILAILQGNNAVPVSPPTITNLIDSNSYNSLVLKLKVANEQLAMASKEREELISQHKKEIEQMCEKFAMEQQKLITKHEEQIQTLQTSLQQVQQSNTVVSPLSCEIEQNSIAKGEKIGSGGCATVNKGTLEVAIKEVHIKTMFDQEVEIMASLNSPYIVRIFGYCSKGLFPSIVMEYISGGSLFDLLYKTTEKITERQAIVLALDVANGLHYLHTRIPSIIHRDIKPANLLCYKKNNELHCKMTDFGVSNMVHKFAVTKTGTELYMAPETSSGKYTLQADIFSFGVLLFEMVTGTYPMDLAQQAQQHKVPCNMKSSKTNLPILQDTELLIHACLQVDASKRPTSQQLIEKIDAILKKL